MYVSPGPRCLENKTHSAPAAASHFARKPPERRGRRRDHRCRKHYRHQHDHRGAGTHLHECRDQGHQAVGGFAQSKRSRPHCLLQNLVGASCVAYIQCACTRSCPSQAQTGVGESFGRTGRKCCMAHLGHALEAARCGRGLSCRPSPAWRRRSCSLLRPACCSRHRERGSRGCGRRPAADTACGGKGAETEREARAGSGPGPGLAAGGEKPRHSRAAWAPRRARAQSRGRLRRRRRWSCGCGAPRASRPRAQPPALQTGRATAPRPPCTQCVCVCVCARACTNETPPASALCTHCECVRASVHETPLSLPASISLAPQRKLGLRTGGQREHRDVGAAASGRAPDQTRRRCKEDARKQHHRPALRC